jgi:hypothetical protein
MLAIASVIAAFVERAHRRLALLGEAGLDQEARMFGSQMAISSHRGLHPTTTRRRGGGVGPQTQFLAAGMQNSHENGGRAFLIFVADTTNQTVVQYTFEICQ